MKVFIMLPLLVGGCVGANRPAILRDVDTSYSLTGNLNDRSVMAEWTLAPAQVQGQGRPSVTLRVQGSAASDQKAVIPLQK